MKIMHLGIIGTVVIFFGIIFTNTYAFADADLPSSTPENVGNGPYHYTDNTLQTQFTIPVVVAIIAIVAGIGI